MGNPPATDTPATDTAGRILDAAEHCMGRHGLRVSMNDVAVHAGLSRRTVYHHYPNRDALVGAVLERTVAAFVAAVAPHVDRQPTLADQVAEAAVQITRHQQDVDFTLHLPQRSDSLLATVLVLHLDHLLQALVDFWVVRLEAAAGRGELAAGLDIPQVGEWIVRLTFSFALMPAVVIDLGDEAAIRAFIRTHLRGITTT